MKRKKILLTFVFCCAMLQLCFAQYMDVHLITGNIDQYTISDVKTITFSGNNMNINKINTTTYATLLDDINKITFSDLITSVTAATTENDEIFKIYPNPANSKFTVTTPEGTKQIKILNAFGQLVNTVNVDGQKSLNFEIQTNGIYFIQLITDNQTITKKILIVK